MTIAHLGRDELVTVAVCRSDSVSVDDDAVAGDAARPREHGDATELGGVVVRELCRACAERPTVTAQFLHDERHVLRDDLELREVDVDGEREGNDERLRVRVVAQLQPDAVFGRMAGAVVLVSDGADVEVTRKDGRYQPAGQLRQRVDIVQHSHRATITRQHGDVEVDAGSDVDEAADGHTQHTRARS